MVGRVDVQERNQITAEVAPPVLQMPEAEKIDILTPRPVSLVHPSR